MEYTSAIAMIQQRKKEENIFLAEHYIIFYFEMIQE